MDKYMRFLSIISKAENKSKRHRRRLMERELKKWLYGEPTRRQKKEILDWMEEYLDGTNPERRQPRLDQSRHPGVWFDGWIDLHEVVIESFYETTEEMSESS